ncbi:MAG TPA: PAS domain-containing protein, partial [Candidatus Dormibacteraeota bacterium]|nr:PAS domain-containing protein [Candidatus Dormibacteraeota bacterium]
MGLTLGSSAWIYIEGSEALNRLSLTHGPGSTRTTDPSTVPVVMKEVDSWIRQLSLATSAGAAGMAVLVMIVLFWLRHRAARRMQKYEDELTGLSSTLEKANTDLMQQKTERRRLETDLAKVASEIEKKVQDRTAQLSTSHAQLQKELNDRRQAERVMAQQAKELERSKDVLELHVQARTQELQKLQRRYESILNSAGEGIYGLDLQGRTTFVNPAAAKITGWKVEELVGKSEAEVFHRLPTPAETAPQAEHGDYQLFYRKDGSSFPAEYVRTPIREKDKEVG